MLKKLRFSQIKKEINAMDFPISSKTVLLQAMFFIALSFFAGLALRLDIRYILALSLIATFLTPRVLIYKHKIIYESRRFDDAVSYMERLIYSYQRSGKLYTALLEVRDAMPDRVASIIQKAIDHIDNEKTENDLYREALQHIEEHFSCTRTKNLHRYIVESEKNGDKNDTALNMLLDDIRSYALQIKTYKTERNNIKKQVVLSIILALLTCAMVFIMIPKEYIGQITSMNLYKIGTLGALILFSVLYVYTLKSLAKSYFDIELDKEIDDEYNRVKERVNRFNPKKQYIKAAVMAMAAAVAAILLYSTEQYVIIMLIVVVAIAVSYQPFFTHQNDKKKLASCFNMSFPVWLRNVSLLLQTNTVGVALQKSLYDCPVVLAPHVKELLSKLAENPADKAPFDEFCNNFNAPDLKMSVNYMYYLSKFGSNDNIEPLDYLIKQNDHLMIEEEKIRNQNAVSIMNALVLAPMVISIFKLMIDMYGTFSIFSDMIAGF